MNKILTDKKLITQEELTFLLIGLPLIVIFFLGVLYLGCSQVDKGTKEQVTTYTNLCNKYNLSFNQNQWNCYELENNRSISYNIENINGILTVNKLSLLQKE